MIHYWRSFGDLKRFARKPSDAPLEPWKRYNQAVGGDGSVNVWHEIYTLNSDPFECIYANMPRFGLAGAMEHVQVVGRRETARLRLGANKLVNSL